MSSLLSPFNFGQKHAYFHVKITIHELVNVPLVTGHFKARWRVKNIHGLQNIPGTMSHSSHTANEDSHHHQHSHHHHNHHEKDASTGSASVDDSGRSLNHRKSFNSIASHERSNLSSKDDLREGNEHGHRERKTSNRFLAGFKEAFNAKGRRSTSTHKKDEHHHHVVSPLAGGDGSNDSGRGQYSTSRDDLETSKEGAQAHMPRRRGSVKSIAAESDSSHPRTSFHSSKGLNEKDTVGSATANQTALMMQAEPKGETSNEKIREHTIKWERKVEVGIRIPVEKQKLNDKTNSSTPAATASGALTPSGHFNEGSGALPSSSSTISNRSGQSTNKDGSTLGLRGQPSHRSLADRSDADSRIDRDAKEKDRDRELADAWGMLGSAELKITIRGDIPTDTSGSTNANDSHVSIGHVTLNLAEFAPFPESSAHQHHHHHQHHPAHTHHSSHAQHSQSHHHHHLHHHHIVLSRSETRRYLLSDSRTNATLKLTIEMTHMGGSREYAVPAVRRGLIASGISSFVNGSEESHNKHNRKGTNGSSTNSDSNHGSIEGHGRDDGRHLEGGRRSQAQSNNASVASIVHNPISSWPDSSVAKHSRIPASNLSTELSHQDAARAVREAGGHRMGFSFGAGAHHEKPPEEVIESLFNPPKTLSNRASRNKLNRTSSRDSKRNGKLEKMRSLSILPIEGARNIAAGPTSPLSRLPPRSVSDGDDKPPKDADMTPSSSSYANAVVAAPEETTNEEGRRRGHKSTPSNSTMRSILTNSMSSKASLHPQAIPPDQVLLSGSNSGTNSSDSAQMPYRRSSIHNGQHTSSKGHSLVRWDASVTAAEGSKGSSSGISPHSSSDSPKVKGLVLPHNDALTSSPSLMSQRASEDVSPVEEIKSSLPRKDDEDEHDAYLSLCKQAEEEDAFEEVSIAPPSLPPDLARREPSNLMSINRSQQDVSSSSSTNRSHSINSRAMRGLTKQEAIEKGFRGVGWGTLDLTGGPDISRVGLDTHDVCSNSDTSSPASHTRELQV